MPSTLKFSQKILLAASLVMIVAFTLFVLFNDYRQRQALNADVHASLEEVGSLATRNIKTWLEGRIQLVESLAQQLSANGQQGDPLHAALNLPVYGQRFQLTYFGGADGAMTSVPAGNRPADYDPRARGWYQAANAAQGSALTEPYVAASSQKLVITIATPVRQDGQMVGVAGADMELASIAQLLDSLKFQGHGHAFLVSAQGKVLLHPDSRYILKGIDTVYPQDTPKVQAGVSEIEVDGKTQFIAFTPLEGLPSANWYVALVLDQDAAFAMLDEVRTSAIIATLIAVAATVLLLGMLIRLLMQPLHQLGHAMRDIAEGDGDLTKRLTVQAHDEFGAVATSFNRFVERIHGSIREVSSATTQVNQVAKLVLNASNSSMSNSDEQANRTNSVAAAINELGAAAQEIARNAADASHQASSARTLAEDGRQVVERTISAMNELSGKIRASCGNIETLNSKTVNIGQILEVIKGISEQTNLLALNAAIEAARAGEAGRGFAVVADEVRNLAHRTQESAQEIQQMIEELQVGAREAVSTMTESQRYSEQSVEIANQAGERLGSVTNRIGEIDGMNQSVATATEEQTAVVDSLNMDITEINTLNQEGVENLQATLRACADLDQQAARLQQLVGSFRI
ncbi:methyl-accepting chemotaxis protein [Metapseudomonas resinovorans]|uniref:Methyl-accepting chemotaxis transducer n=1 Tax=Metapseudomonas resinovorans NBRC 106553 TaxID=1245471 RepID=S6AQX5_METRE|nr:methyl-accepting chemotaxis protein [Pseudomonas resinovorans]BAN48203.1 methyl-accepting chemotaxis transducer [Pseudomonas resinovorans NBRC 106553]